MDGRSGTLSAVFNFFLYNCWIGCKCVADIITSSLDLRVPYTAWLLAFIAAELSRSIPVSIQGIGIREATFASVGAAVMGEPELFFLVGAAGYAAQSLAVAGSIFQAHIHYRLAK